MTVFLHELILVWLGKMRVHQNTYDWMGKHFRACIAISYACPKHIAVALILSCKWQEIQL